MKTIAFSGGKDSTAMLLRLIEIGEKIDKIMFADTTLEFPEMYEWIKKIKLLINRKITVVKSVKSFDEWFYGIPKNGKAGKRGLIRGFPLKAYPCYWAREAKVRPMEKEQGKGNIIYLGYVINEKSRNRQKIIKNYQEGIKKEGHIYPLVDWGWTEQDCVNYLEQKGLKHPLIDRFKRTGCWLCPKQSKLSLKNLYLYYPKLWKKLKQYARDSPQGFKPNFNFKDFENKYGKNRFD